MKMIQSLQKPASLFPIKLNILLPYNIAILLLRINPPQNKHIAHATPMHEYSCSSLENTTGNKPKVHQRMDLHNGILLRN
jgi:hypothetical protein